MQIKHVKTGQGGLVDPLNDFSLQISDRSAPAEGRRLETLQRVGLGVAKLTDHTASTQAKAFANIAIDRVVTPQEVKLLQNQTNSAQLPLLGKHRGQSASSTHSIAQRAGSKVSSRPRKKRTTRHGGVGPRSLPTRDYRAALSARYQRGCTCRCLDDRDARGRYPQ